MKGDGLMEKSTVVLKKNEALRLTIKGMPQLISLLQDDDVELKIDKYEQDCNIVFTYKGMFVSLWCNSYEIEERSTNE